MKKITSLFIALIALFTVIIQFNLMLENRVASVPETVIRFFSFFTILTNSLAAIYFMIYFLAQKNSRFYNVIKPGNLTAVTVYITIVGLVYQVALRHVWEPKGMQKIVDELLHSIIPVLVIIFWYFYENHKAVQIKSSLRWLLYPLVYLFYILIRGHFSNFYPYPFINVVQLGYKVVVFNSIILVVVFAFVSVLFIKIGHKISKT